MDIIKGNACKTGIHNVFLVCRTSLFQVALIVFAPLQSGFLAIVQSVVQSATGTTVVPTRPQNASHAARLHAQRGSSGMLRAV